MEYFRPLTDALGLTSPEADGEDAPNPLGDPIVVNVDDQSELTESHGRAFAAQQQTRPVGLGAGRRCCSSGLDLPGA